MKHLFVKGLQPPPQGQPPWYPGANAGVTFGTGPPPNPIRGHFWWDSELLWIFDGINWVTDGFSKEMVQDILAEDPSFFVPPIVTDGSLAQLNDIGYVWTATSDGTWMGGGSTTVAPLVNLVVPSNPLLAGDWNFTYKLTIPAVGNAGAGMALMRLPTPLPAGCLNNMSGYNVNIPTNMPPAGDPSPQAFILTGPTTPISLASSLGLVFNLYVWPSGVLPSGPFHVDFWARRVR